MEEYREYILKVPAEVESRLKASMKSGRFNPGDFYTDWLQEELLIRVPSLEQRDVESIEFINYDLEGEE